MNDEQVKMAKKIYGRSWWFRNGIRDREGGLTMRQCVWSFSIFPKHRRIEAWTGWCVADERLKK